MYESNEDLIAQVLQWKNEGVNGLFMFCDLEAWNINLLMHQQGLRIPDDFAIVGFDNIQSRLSVPFNLTSISSHKGRMSVEAVDVLVRRHRHPQK